ncbi:hypothetical protein PMN64_27050 [Bradyrhizobium sp. UFLA01-814]|uniref:hypothetical protein n=1 Tax=Bradyrhizobium sp. UFLA01-814 TaxID=3023480 RepID=UPI00398B93D4
MSLETVLLHKSGEYISSTIDVPVATANDPQAYGSTLTYDDDGKSATVTVEDRCSEIFACQTIDELQGSEHEAQHRLAQ